MMLKLIILGVAAITLASCGFTQTGDFVRETVAVKGAQAMDEGLVNAEWFVCNAASIGSVKRRYGKSAKLADAYTALCNVDPTVIKTILNAPNS